MAYECIFSALKDIISREIYLFITVFTGFQSVTLYDKDFLCRTNYTLLILSNFETGNEVI